jgi:hypothetical protein
MIKQARRKAHFTPAAAALRAWHEGLSTCAAVEQYLLHGVVDGASLRGTLGG